MRSYNGRSTKGISMHRRHLTRLSLCLALALALGCGEEAQDEPAQPPPPAPEDVQPMPPSGFVVQWGAPGVPCQMKAGATVPVSIVATNAGDQLWRDLANSDKGRGAVRLGYRWWGPGPSDVPVIDHPVGRGELKGPVLPGGSATLTVEVVAPTAPGSYLLQLDLVEELITWFDDKGAAKVMVPVTVN